MAYILTFSHTLAIVCSFIFINLQHSRAGLGDVESSRLVLTFETANENTIDGVNLDEATVVKQYGRRLVLDLGSPFDLDFEEERFRMVFKSVQSVEIDYLIGLQQTDLTQITEEYSLNVTRTNSVDPDVDGAYISPATQTPLWNLMDSEPFSIHSEGVWQVTNSTHEAVVAVIDTGIAEPARLSGLFLNLLNGYDFISDEGISVDGDGRDSDATDPGDWGEMCLTPSWHGTKTASILAARHDNKHGMKGVAQNCSILPLRVLGLCRTGYATDVADAIVWAAGGSINGVPDNTNPAQIISLSLAGQGKCPGYLQSAISQAVALGSTIITAAGNSNNNVSRYFPANCKDVIAVGASTREGNLAVYSNWGELIALSAPGGDSSNAIMTLSVDIPETGLEVAYGMGTSFAVPHVAGVAALYISLSLNDWYKSAIPIQSFTRFISFAVRGDCIQYLCGKGILSADKMISSEKNNSFVETIAYWNASTNQSVESAIIIDLTLGISVPIGRFCCNFDRYSMYNELYAICLSTCPCQPGKYSSSINQLQCTFCPPGSVSKETYGSTSFDSACSLCPVNTYGSVPSTSCTPCLSGTYSNPGSPVCKPAILCSSGYRLNPTYETVSSNYVANCPIGSYVCGFNYQNLFGYYFYCCALGGLQVGHWRVSNANFNAGVDAGVFYTSTYNGYPLSPFTSPNTLNVLQYGISRITWNWNGATIYSNGAILYVTGGTGGDIYDSSCPNGKTTTGFYGWWGANIDQVSVVCNTLCIACSTCPAGKYIQTACTTSTDSICGTCPAGKYSTFTGASICIACSAGKYSVIYGASLESTCIYCEPGKYSNTGASCYLCIAGKYSVYSGAKLESNCTVCTAGSYSSINGSSSCTVCEAGKYSTSGSNACISCSLGKYSLYPGAKLESNCTVCAAGAYSSISGSPSCTACEAGKYSSAAGASSSTACKLCIPPTYCIIGSVTPQACPAGYYCTNSSTKSPCPQGGYCPINSTSVRLCPVGSQGKVGASSNSSNCIACLPGKYTSSEGVTVCSACTNGKYASAYGSVNCSSCGTPPVCQNAPGYIQNCSTSSAALCIYCNDADKPLYSSWMKSNTIQYSCIWSCDNYYFKLNSSTCKACKSLSSCAYNQYVTSCNSTADGKCLNCNNKPLNSFYTSVSSLFDISDCGWNCNAGFSLNQATYRCDACLAGKYSTGNFTTCTACPPGSYSMNISSSVCSICTPNTYTPTAEATSCTRCPICVNDGYYATGCAGTSPGKCQTCTNVIK
jgi:hypothetical protein